MLTKVRCAGLGVLLVAGVMGGCATSQTGASAQHAPAQAATDQEATAEQPAASAASEAGEGAKPAQARTHTVRAGRIAVEFDLSGHFESEQMVELVLRPEVWKEFRVLEAVAPGTAVKKGDTLVKLDTTKIDEALRDMETDAAIASLNLRLAEYELALLRQTIPMDLEAAERRARQSAEDRQFYEQIGRPLTLKGVEVNLRSAESSLAYANEELVQLLKMYEADDLVEETEQMIIRRQRDAVARAEHALERARVEAKTTLEFGLPRRDEQVKTEELRSQLQWNHAQATLPIQLQLKELGLAKARREHDKAAERRENLRKDRSMMDITAPIDGIVYYGRAERGRFASSPQVAQKLRPDGAIAPNEVFMTIVQPRPLQVRVDVPEAQIRHVKPDVLVRLTPTAYPNVTFEGKVVSVSSVPTAPGQFEALIAVEDNKAGEAVLPGMACSLKVIPYENKAAVLVPEDAVFRDGNDRVVYVKTDAGHERRVVKVGRSANKLLEILEGLKAGETILLDKPESSKG